MPAALLLPACNGIFGGIYDEPDTGQPIETVAGQLYIDASDWTQWHYIDLPSLAENVIENPGFNTSSAWQTFGIPLDRSENDRIGIYTYWYDVFGEGISKREYRDFYPTEYQPEPKKWSFAVHRNNVRTNGGAACRTDFTSLDELPSSESDYYDSLIFTEDEWSESDVWVDQSTMLSGIIGNQGIMVNMVLSSWLTVEIPPMPPAFRHDPHVFVLRLSDGSMVGMQLSNYMNSNGKKCCLSIKYRYPL